MPALIKWFDGMLDRIFSVAGAVGLSQFPAYFQQYLQRLGGHADEAHRQAELFRRAAMESGMSMDDYIQKFLDQTDRDFQRQGEIIREIIERADYLASALEALQSSNMFTRPFVFLTTVDWEIAGNTWAAFQPAVPTTVEGAVYAGVGILVGLAIYYTLIKGPAKMIAGKKERKEEDEE